ncbi:DUF5996 family protein [Modestobacter sp. Leaf380]|uniref:DUF5996 family protein n=1 Tax=Modestobacter sp. Leaf380 TaxID=1736356 RepID=UPI000701967F|nr:DUF5996 family protein [Modestobacter sp. Leaf380]KQS73684.1 hypothetical protein ASG41_03515 [Modestobacter sp. Leaf380]
MELLPPIPYAGWADTLATVHRVSQLVGRVRLLASPRRNHWWNVPLHVSGRGTTTRPMGLDPTFTIDLDLLDHRLDVSTVEGRRVSSSLLGRSVADVHADLTRALAELGIDVDVADARPFDLPDAARPFAADTEHASWDPVAVTRYWQVLSQVSLLLEEFAGGFSGKTSPVHHFWHTFDLALTRFSDRVVAQPDADPVTREAYSREVVSSGFWFGDPSHPDPAFYSYTAPEPAGLEQDPLPEGATWLARGGSHLAVLPYDVARAADDPRAAVLAFYEAAYTAGATRAGWDVPGLACAGGVSDPTGPASPR